MTDFSKILDKAKELESKMKESQENIKKLRAEGLAGANSIKVILDGDGQMLKIEISDEILKENKSIIEDLILETINSISKKDISFIINTHFHYDHVDGNKAFGKKGIPIISHENVRKRMSVENVVRGKKSPASPKEALPVITFSKDMMVHFNGEDVVVSHVHNAHTDGDAHVYFTSSNVLHMGDTYFQGKFPFIDLSSGGSIDGYIAAIDKALIMTDDKTVIIPGHRGLSNRKELLGYKEMLVTLRDRVQVEIEKGKTLKEVKEDKSITKEYAEEYGNWFISAEGIRETIYKSLKEK